MLPRPGPGGRDHEVPAPGVEHHRELLLRLTDLPCTCSVYSFGIDCRIAVIDVGSISEIVRAANPHANVCRSAPSFLLRPTVQDAERTSIWP